MKVYHKVLVLAICLTAFSGFSSAIARADDSTITDGQIELIRNECVSIKSTLNRIHASDALLRVNMGQIYEAISTKLMDGFNGRVANNDLNNTEFVSISEAYKITLNNFRANYISYETQLSDAMDIDCTKQPVTFYDSVMSARSKRATVHADVVKLNNYIAQYGNALDEFEKSYQMEEK